MKKFKLLIFSSLLLFTFPTIVHAYIDPATGSIIIQVIVGALSVVGIFLSNFFKSIFRKNNKEIEKKAVKDDFEVIDDD